MEYEQLASAYIAAHRPEEAVSTLKEGLETSPLPRLWTLLGEVLYNDGAFEDAYGAFEQSALLDPKDGRPFIMKAHCAIALRKGDTAVQALSEARRFPKQRAKAEELLNVVDSWKPLPGLESDNQ